MKKTILTVTLLTIGWVTFGASFQYIDVGTTTNSNTGDTLRDSLIKVNTNFWWLEGGNLSTNMALKADSGTNYGISFLRLGETVLQTTRIAPTWLTNSAEVSGTNWMLSIPTNGLGSTPRLLTAPATNQLSWTYATNQAGVTGTNYVFTWPTNGSVGLYKAVVEPDFPGVIRLTDLLKLFPRTVTNSTDTTWGNGSGLVCVDSNYVYISVWTNLWKRVALSW